MEPARMMRLVPSGQTRSSASWLWQAATGVLLVPLLALHIIAQHFVVKGGERNFGEVVSFLTHPAIMVVEVLFLIVVTSHAMLGIRSILFDLGLPQRLRANAGRVLTGLGIVTAAYGVWLTITIVR